jgi:hypothetical protein
MQKRALVIVAGLAMSLLSIGSLQAKEIDDDTKAKKGVVRCGGNNNLRQGGTEIQFSSYTFRNFNAAASITIERLTFFDATGAVLFDSNASGFPAFANGVLGPADQVLDANQTAQLDTPDLLPFLPETLRPIQLEIVWSASEKVLLLHASQTRIGRQRDAVTGAQLQERSRDSGRCDTISAK